MTLRREILACSGSAQDLERRRETAELLDEANRLRHIGERDDDDRAHALADAYVNRLRVRAATEEQIERLKERAERRAQKVSSR